MMLFDLEKESEPPMKETNGKSIIGSAEHLLPVSNKLNEALSLIGANSCVHWLTEGDWSMHDMLVGLLHMTGPATVYISSYAFSRYPALLIADLKKQKIIDKLYCILDNRLDVRNADALNLLRNAATRYKLLHTHAKVTVIENDQYLVAVVGSANYTTNKRYESGVIITEPGVAAFHRDWIIKAMNDENI